MTAECIKGFLARPLAAVFALNYSEVEESVAFMLLRSAPFHVDPRPDAQYHLTVPEEHGKGLTDFLRTIAAATAEEHNRDQVLAQAYQVSSELQGIRFDCAYFLAIAPEEMLRRLAAHNWRATRKLRIALQLLVARDAQVRELFELNDEHNLDFVVQVPKLAAIGWLMLHRPEVSVAGRLEADD